MGKRIGELDFLKGICILLMIVFHLVYIGDKYPLTKQFVYTFHMPIFLMISGYLMHVEKPARRFFASMLWIFIPYVIMESGYVVMSSILPVRDKVDDLSAGLWLEKLFLDPMGPYWYLHTLVLCGVTYWVVDRCGKKLDMVSRLILLALCLWIEADCVSLMVLSNAFYFMVGVVLHQCRMAYTGFFRPSWLAIVPLVLLACFPANFERFTLGGMAIVYTVSAFLLAVYGILPVGAARFINYWGANSFVLLVFSPVFTMLVKPLVPLFSFDPTGICFLAVALTLAVAGSWFLARVMDLLHLSRFFWGKDVMLQKYPTAE
ncbi:acyltransferase [uncultured Bacteroides sp.]|uniref:acyltransferase family protein n=1 Tax=uncultured Bacteroides sp. TaxID=162156 RepID=UPI0026324C37|nr:acyltransferase [uncultured Bacteroides sp.]